MTSKRLSICECRTSAAVLVSLLCLVVAGATHEWNPNGSGGWGDSTRWKGGGTPGTGDTVSFSGCTGLDDTSRWTLSINGNPASGRRLRVSSEGIAIVPVGFCISFR